jgi:hypothetical protein
MANTMAFDETRALRREQREARIARKRERRDARTLKRRHNTAPIEALAWEAPAAPQPDTEEAAITVESVAPDPPATPRVKTAPSAEPTPAAPVVPIEAPLGEPPRSDPRAAQRIPRRERDIAEFLERREERLSLAREEARERIERLSEEDAVHDALMQLAHSQASAWRQHRERLSDALASRRIREIGAAARRACRGAANDAARTSRKAPDPELAMAVAVAYAVIAQAPWAAIRGRRAERAVPAAQAFARPLSR